MFESISWEEFFYALAVLGVLYYALAGLLLYKEELQTLFREGIVKRKENSEQTSIETDASFLGEIAKPSNDNQQDREELSFAPRKTRDDESADFTVSLDTTLVGTVADLGEDIKHLSSEIGQTTRQQVTDRFSLLLKKYAKLNSTSYRATINMLIEETIREKSNHTIGTAEINSWWPQQEK